jgi:hypothetical protein
MLGFCYWVWDIFGDFDHRRPFFVDEEGVAGRKDPGGQEGTGINRKGGLELDEELLR